jgi:hypothetical protein
MPIGTVARRRHRKSLQVSVIREAQLGVVVDDTPVNSNCEAFEIDETVTRTACFDDIGHRPPSHVHQRTAVRDRQFGALTGDLSSRTADFDA